MLLIWLKGLNACDECCLKLSVPVSSLMAILLQNILSQADYLYIFVALFYLPFLSFDPEVKTCKIFWLVLVDLRRLVINCELLLFDLVGYLLYYLYLVLLVLTKLCQFVRVLLETLLHLAFKRLHAFFKVCILSDTSWKVHRLTVNPFDILRVLMHLGTCLLQNRL